MERYKVTLTGETDLLMNSDNLDFDAILEKWKRDPANKGESVAGDDRSPAWRWLRCLYSEGGLVVIPSDNLMTALREGGAKVPTGKRGATFKRQTQSGLMVDQIGWPIMVGGKSISARGLKEQLADEKDFDVHQEAAMGMGFDLFVKRARIGRAKHVRVRPRFSAGWTASGTISVIDETITKDVLQMILDYSGTLCGLCDWRPSSPSAPGPFGRFTAVVE